MENPATWTAAEHIISQVVSDHFAQKDRIGLSLPRKIADALRQANLLHDSRPEDTNPS